MKLDLQNGYSCEFRQGPTRFKAIKKLLMSYLPTICQRIFLCVSKHTFRMFLQCYLPSFLLDVCMYPSWLIILYAQGVTQGRILSCARYLFLHCLSNATTSVISDYDRNVIRGICGRSLYNLRNKK